MVTRLAYGAGLTVVWVLAWGSASVANVLGGMAVATVLLALAPDTWPKIDRPPVRPVAIARLTLRVLVKLVESNVSLTREVVARRSRIKTGVVGVPLPPCSDGLLTLVTNLLALTPGTIPIEVTRDPTVIYVHVLQLHDVEAARSEVRDLAELAFRAFGSEAAVASLDHDDHPTPAEPAADPTDPEGEGR